jgi:hypothetical protein
VARSQLVRLGLGNSAIDHRIGGGREHPLHSGVYAVGHPLVSRAGAWMAAVLAAGPGAVLSHHAAAALWGIRETRRSTPDVIAPRRVDRPRLHARRIALAHDETTVHRGIPVTTPARTLLDLAGTLNRQQREAAITEAEIGASEAQPPSPPCSRGIPDDEGSRPSGRSFRTPTSAAPSPAPTSRSRSSPSSTPTASRARLIAELDSSAIHTTRRNFEEDRARDRALTAAGWRVVRITWRQLHHDATPLAAQLRTPLGR